MWSEVQTVWIKIRPNNMSGSSPTKCRLDLDQNLCKGFKHTTQAGKDSPETTKCFKPSSKSKFTDRSKAVFLLWVILLFMFRVYRVFLSVHCSLVATSWESADLLALLTYVMFYCVFVTFTCDVLGQVWCLVVLIPDLSYFVQSRCLTKVQSKWKSESD